MGLINRSLMVNKRAIGSTNLGRQEFIPVLQTRWVVPMGLVNSSLMVNKRAIGSTHL
jgi:hypothetical protein